MEEFYSEHIASKALGESLAQFGEQLSTSVDKVINLTANAAADHATFETQVSKLGSLLAGIKDPTKTLQIIKGLVQATNLMQSRSTKSTSDLEALQETVQKLRSEVSAIRQDSLTDELTKIGNRRRFERDYAQAFDLARKNSVPLTIAMIDIDHFKAFNDRWGHLVGDAALRSVATRLHERLERHGVICRYGGEEFIAILPHMDSTDAAGLLEQIRVDLNKTPLVRRDSLEPIGHVTASFGIAQLQAEDTPDSLISRADDYLYKAKAGGRNQLAGDHEATEVSNLVARIKSVIPREEPEEGRSAMRA